MYSSRSGTEQVYDDLATTGQPVHSTARCTSRPRPGKPDDEGEQTNFYDHRVDVKLQPRHLPDYISNRNDYKQNRHKEVRPAIRFRRQHQRKKYHEARNRHHHDGCQRPHLSNVQYPDFAQQDILDNSGFEEGKHIHREIDEQESCSQPCELQFHVYLKFFQRPFGCLRRTQGSLFWTELL